MITDQKILKKENPIIYNRHTENVEKKTALFKIAKLKILKKEHTTVYNRQTENVEKRISHSL